MIKLIGFDLDNTLYDEEKGELYNGVQVLLNNLSKKYKLALITNGSQKNQEPRIKDIKNYFTYIYYVGFFDRHKPDPWAFNELMKDSKLTASEIIYVGNNPFTDFIPCKLSNIQSIRVNTSEYKNRKVDSFLEADVVVEDLEGLSILISKKYGNYK